VNDIHFELKADGGKLPVGLEVTASGNVEEMSIDGRDVLPGRFARSLGTEWPKLALDFFLLVVGVLSIVAALFAAVETRRNTNALAQNTASSAFPPKKKNRDRRH
jgi:type II secretory pathway component PulL